jgi:hypothetical protein
MKVRLLFGVGINDAGYVVRITEDVGNEGGKRIRKKIWECPFYSRWRNMLLRCYSEKYQKITPTYKECFVCDEWLRFSNFKSWMEKQDWQGKELDKDLLYKGNKIYSPKTCVFIDRILNSFVVERDASRGKYPIGVYWNENHKKYIARCQNPFSKKYEYLGRFDNPQEAHHAWLNKKKELAELLAEQQTDSRIALALRKRYDNY